MHRNLSLPIIFLQGLQGFTALCFVIPIMPTKCCDPGCRTGYDNKPHQSGVTLHLWPKKERNSGLDTTWLRAIPRETGLKKPD
uniref:Uncharacterized protein n=1 Tax=Lepeophtheirus salmonis TaxID=72036 RepID=A0A0K2SVW4_LEPSM